MESQFIQDAASLGPDIMNALGIGKRDIAMTLRAYSLDVPTSAKVGEQYKRVLEQVDLETLARVCLWEIKFSLSGLSDTQTTLVRTAYQQRITLPYEHYQDFPLAWTFLDVNHEKKRVSWSALGEFFMRYEATACNITPQEVEGRRMKGLFPALPIESLEQGGKIDEVIEALPEDIEIPPDLFDCIIGYDDVKDAIKFTLTSGRRNHYLFIGPPATAKSLFLWELGRLRGTYQATGSRVTAAGLTDAFSTYQPRTLLLDEIDKIPMDATAVLLSVMETGDVLVTKYKIHLQLKLDLIVFAAGNTDKTIAPELLSRFDTKLYFPPYTFEDFVAVCRGYLSRYEGVPDEVAEYIGKQTWHQLERDVRTARGIARRLREKTIADVDRTVRFSKKYAKGS